MERDGHTCVRAVRPPFRDVPLVELVDEQLVVVRGSVHDADRTRIVEQIKALIVNRDGDRAPADAVFGVFGNDLGGLGVTPVGWLVEDDWRWVHRIEVRHLLFGDTTAELAATLREHAELLQRAAEAGWQYHDVDTAGEIVLVLPTYAAQHDTR